MLGDKDAVATIAVRNLDVAKKFYEGTLGLELAERQQDGTLAFKSGKSLLFVYPSSYAGTNKATAATWAVAGDEVDSIVKTLKAKGVRFEHYDLPGSKREGDVHVGHGVRVAWLKDPDGNILSIAGGSSERTR